jgi:hypothetical protein
MARIRVRRQASRHVYPHNDLRQAAYHFKTQIDARFAANDLKGISYDILAELVFLAFSIEAQVNFLGSKLVAGWKERDCVDDKFKKVLKQIGLTPDWNKRPFSTARVLKELRDGLAHGKPDYRELDEIVVIEQDESDDPSFADLKGGWEVYCTATFYREAYEDVDEIWKQMLAKSGMRYFDTLTGGERSIHYIEHVTDDSTPS